MSDHKTTGIADRPLAGAAPDPRSMGDLIRDLADKSGRLVREEIALVKAEMREKTVQFTQSAKMMVVGGAMLMASMLLMLVAVNRGLTALLVQFVSVETAVWLSPVILAVVFGLIGMGMLRSAGRAIKDVGLAPAKSIASISEGKAWIKQTAKEARNG